MANAVGHRFADRSGFRVGRGDRGVGNHGARLVRNGAREHRRYLSQKRDRAHENEPGDPTSFFHIFPVPSKAVDQYIRHCISRKSDSVAWQQRTGMERRWTAPIGAQKGTTEGRASQEEAGPRHSGAPQNRPGNRFTPRSVLREFFKNGRAG